MKRSVYLVCFCLLFLSAWSAASTVNEVEGILKRANTPISQMDIKRRQAPHMKDYHFVFIFKSTCPHCHKFAPVLKSFATRYHLPVKAYSTDGGQLPGFIATPLTSAGFQKFYVEGNYSPAVPALFLINHVTHQAYAVLFGEANAPQLMSRMNALMKDIKVSYEK